jgi:hypothetical protein
MVLKILDLLGASHKGDSITELGEIPGEDKSSTKYPAAFNCLKACHKITTSCWSPLNRRGVNLRGKVFIYINITFI